MPADRITMHKNEKRLKRRDGTQQRGWVWLNPDTPNRAERRKVKGKLSTKCQDSYHQSVQGALAWEQHLLILAEAEAVRKATNG